METNTETLNSLMEFDHVIQVHEDGTVSEPSGVYAPEVYDGIPPEGEWSLMDGYSGQDRYSGPVMHPSEYIGGQMARDILATPGYYVAVVVIDLDAEDDEDDATGWAVAYRT